MSRILEEKMEWVPNGYHYVYNRGDDREESVAGAREYLIRQGCTRIIHVTPPDNGLCQSFGIVEPAAAVLQRVNEPQYG